MDRGEGTMATRLTAADLEFAGYKAIWEANNRCASIIQDDTVWIVIREDGDVIAFLEDEATQRDLKKGRYGPGLILGGPSYIADDAI